MCYLLTFMYIFAFKIYSIIDSSILVMVGLMIFALINKEYRIRVIKEIFSKYSLCIIICLIVIVCWSIFTTLINTSYDFSYIKTLIHLSISIITGIELIAYFKYKGKQDKIVNCIIIAFIIQSLLQWIFFLFPDFSKLFNIFRTESMTMNNIKYSGRRGLSISSSGFFGLSSAYAIVSILYVTKYNTLFKNYIVKFLMFILMFSGTLFAGRTGFVALPFIFIILLVKAIKNRKELLAKINKKTIILLFISVVVIIAILIATSQSKKFSDMYSHAFELVNNILSGKGLTTTSTDKLFEMYNRDIPVKTFFIGDGKYTVANQENGSYYMNTDVGYLRKIFYFGIVGLIFSFILQYFLLDIKKKEWQKIYIFVFLAVLELKGEIIGINIIVNSIILLYTNTIKINEKEKENVQINSSNDNIQ